MIDDELPPYEVLERFFKSICIQFRFRSTVEERLTAHLVMWEHDLVAEQIELDFSGADIYCDKGDWNLPPETVPIGD